MFLLGLSFGRAGKIQNIFRTINAEFSKMASKSEWLRKIPFVDEFNQFGLLKFILMKLLFFCNEWLESIFDGMLISFVHKQFWYFGPTFFLFIDVTDQDIILTNWPFTFRFGRIQMIQPSLSALFWCSEKFPLWFNVKKFG